MLFFVFFLSFSEFYSFLVHVKKVLQVKKAHGPHQQELFSPTENSPPELPENASSAVPPLNSVTFLSLHYVTVSHIFITYAYKTSHFTVTWSVHN